MYSSLRMTIVCMLNWVHAVSACYHLGCRVCRSRTGRSGIKQSLIEFELESNGSGLTTALRKQLLNIHKIYECTEASWPSGESAC